MVYEIRIKLGPINVQIFEFGTQSRRFGSKVIRASSDSKIKIPDSLGMGQDWARYNRQTRLQISPGDIFELLLWILDLTFFKKLAIEQN